jgi:hypothetical protein
MPGAMTAELISLGKSDLPDPTTAAPAFRASSGMISGMGFARANMMAPGAMLFTISFETIPGADSPMKTSVPSIISFRLPCRRSMLVLREISDLAQLRGWVRYR